MATITKFEDLEVWKLARKLNRMIYSYFEKIKSHKDFALLDQMNRSCGSIMDNIAEGFGRGGNKEFVQFLSISKGSAEEFKSQLHRAVDRDYLTKRRIRKHLFTFKDTFLQNWVVYQLPSKLRSQRDKI